MEVSDGGRKHDPMTEEQLLRLGRALGAVRDERHRQHARWGFQDMPMGTAAPGAPFALLLPAVQARVDELTREGKLTYADVVIEELVEVLAEPEDGNWSVLRRELVQLAAVLVQAVECGDARHGEPPEQRELAL